MVAAAIPVSLLVWMVMQFGIWHLVDLSAAADFTPVVFAAGHAMFGILAALVAVLLIDDEVPLSRR